MIGTLSSAVEGGIKGGSGGGPSKKRKKDDDSGLPSYHKGGKVKHTGAANLQKGEVVISRKQASKRKHKRGRK